MEFGLAIMVMASLNGGTQIQRHNSPYCHYVMGIRVTAVTLVTPHYVGSSDRRYRTEREKNRDRKMAKKLGTWKIL